MNWKIKLWKLTQREDCKDLLFLNPAPELFFTQKKKKKILNPISCQYRAKMLTPYFITVNVKQDYCADLFLKSKYTLQTRLGRR